MNEHSTKNDSRKTRLRSSWAAAAILAVAVLRPTPLLAQPSPGELLLSAENSVFPDSFRAVITLMTREDGDVTSEMELSLEYKHEVGSYMEVLAPARSRGLRFLEADETLWMYNPRAGGGRALRLSRRAAFQGSTFSNRDLINPEFADDYSVELWGSETIDHPDLGPVKCWVLEAIAMDDQIAYARVRQQANLVSTMTITSLEVADDIPDRTFTQRYLTR